MKYLILHIKSRYDKFHNSFENIADTFIGSIETKKSRDDKNLIELLLKSKFLRKKEIYSVYRTKGTIKIKFFNTGIYWQDQPVLELITYKDWRAVSYRKEFNEIFKIKNEKIICRPSNLTGKFSSKIMC